jgi:excisionase family DNA binding protein
VAARVVELLTLAEAADRAGLSYQTIWKYASEGRFPVYKGGRVKNWHISATDLANFLALSLPTANATGVPADDGVNT